MSAPGTSGTNSKRPSPPSGFAVSASKRLKNDDDLRPGENSNSGTATPHATSTSHASAIDPDKLSDALLSAGVDLKEEENLLSSTLQRNDFQNRTNTINIQPPPPPLIQTPFLDPRNLQNSVRRATNDQGIRYVLDKDNEIASLISASCEEWLSNIVTSAVSLSRHRRRSRNDVHSSIAKALRIIAIKDKEREEKAAAHKLAVGLAAGDPAAVDEKKQLESEESQHRATNATVQYMSAGRKNKYSWMDEGDSSQAATTPAASGSRARRENTIRFREAREEPGLALRDLLGSLEERRFGVDKAIVKGYARMNK